MKNGRIYTTIPGVLLKTMGVGHFIAQRVPRRNKLVSFKFPTNKNMKNEDAVHNMFQRMGVAGTDAWVVHSKQTVAERLGTRANADQGSLDADSKNIIVLELSLPVEAQPSSWTVTLHDGKTKEIQTIFVAEDLIWVHWKKRMHPKIRLSGHKTTICEYLASSDDEPAAL